MSEETATIQLTNGQSTVINRISRLLLQYQVILFAILVLVRGIAYMIAVPTWQHPDEPTQYEHVRMIADSGRLPVITDVSLPLRREIADSMLQHNFWKGIQQPQLNDKTLSTKGTSPIGIYTFAQPRLYYIVAATWLKPWLGQSIETQVNALRFLAVLFNLVVVVCAYQSVRWLFPDYRHLATAVTAFVVFLPGNTDIMSAVNNDCQANMLGAVFFLVVAWLFSHTPKWWSALGAVVLAGLVVAAGMATKTTLIGLLAAIPIGAIAVVYAWIIVFAKRHHVLRISLAVSLLIAIAVCAVIVYVLQGPLYASLGGFQLWLSKYLRANIIGTLHNMLNPQTVSYGLSIDIVFKSFWAVFGWRHIYIAIFWYQLLSICIIAAIAGLVVCTIKLIRTDKVKAISATRRNAALYCVYGFVSVVAVWLVAIVRSQAVQGIGTYVSHGRYAYVAIVPFAILFAIALLGWLPDRWRQRGTILFVVALVAFDAVCYFGYLVPYYHS